MARLLALDVIDGTGLYEVECVKLDDYYKALKCDCFDITRRKVNGRAFDIFCDDIGLFVDNPIPSALDSNMKPALVGNLIFANHDIEGNTISLSDEDIEIIKNAVITIVNVDSNPIKEWQVVFPIDY